MSTLQATNQNESSRTYFFLSVVGVMDKLTGNLVHMLSAAYVFLSKNLIFYVFIIGLLVTIFIRLYVVKRIQRLTIAIWRNLFNLEDDHEDVHEDTDDEGFVRDDYLFRDLNPEQSVELHRRRRFEAAAEALGNKANEELIGGSNYVPNSGEGKL
ncbi:uncharacterized protein LOC108033547 [Drosophila biarmipes]|uniref:uncharacterized protein LOC108033547 n=1 Tax=Drosophila biarmipes TaxID=125945 RepID=UPI001CDAE894|nr:uncharacterized protein LOC108033547 [Drosophila biarmipes]